MSKKYAYATGETWQNDAERAIFAKVIRYAIAARGRTTALRIVDGETSEVELATLTDADLRPENGYYILGHNLPVTGNLQTTKGLTNKVIAFKEDAGGQVWAIMRCQWSAPACVPVSTLTPEQAAALNAEEIQKDGEAYYMIEALPIDMTDIIDSFVWDTITDTEPTWPAPPEVE